jgi:Lantibiotic biosynthesis dehydratase C-term
MHAYRSAGHARARILTKRGRRRETVKNWFNLHIYYHADQDHLIREAILPLLKTLYEEIGVRRFFFVRYELGGSHIRLRLETPVSKSIVSRSARSQLEKFLAAVPSLHSMDRARIEQINQMLLASDKNENDSSIYPDNSIREFAFRPEVARYGGPDLLLYSFDLFTFTTAESLALIHDAAALPRGEAVTRSIRALIRASLALATRYEELPEIWRPWHQALPRPTTLEQEQKARRLLEDLAWTEISKKDESWERWSAAGSNLRHALASEPGETQTQIVRSQIHMFANRLDISNSVERGLGALMAEIFEARRRDWHLPEMAGYADWLGASCRNAFARVKEPAQSGLSHAVEVAVPSPERG